MDGAWNKLLEFQSYDLIKNMYLKKHCVKPKEAKIRQISCNFIQGREYFRNYEQASYTVQPLLLYYGILSLSRGLILFLDQSTTEAAMKKGHGLSSIRWSETVASGLKSIEDLEIEICNGTFSELLQVTENKSYLKHNSSGLNGFAKYPIPEHKKSVNFKQLVKTLPDLIEEYEAWQNVRPLLFPLTSLKNEDDNHIIHIPVMKHITLDDLDKLFGQEASTSIINKNNYFDVTTSNGEYYLTQKFINNFDIGQVYIGQSATQNIKLSTLATFFCLSYCLGMLCRYFPSTWISLEQLTEGDSVYPLAKKLLTIMFKFYPMLILDFLNVGPYEFET